MTKKENDVENIVASDQCVLMAQGDPPAEKCETKTKTCNACPHCLDVCSNTDCKKCKKKRLLRISRGQFFTRCEVARHNSSTDAWLVKGAEIYDVTKMVKFHPGGEHAICRNAGSKMCCEQDFKYHSLRAQNMWKKFKIGTLVPCEGHPARDQSLRCTLDSGCAIM